MLSEAHKQIASRWFDEVWNHGHREAIGELLAPDALLHEGSTTTVGPEGFYSFFDCMQAAFSEIHFTVHEAIAEGDKVCVQWSGTMRHTGFGLGVPPTNELLDITGISIVRIVDNRVAERWQNWDIRTLIQLVYNAKLAQASMERSGCGGHLHRQTEEWTIG
jgi:predicted ester cyclase